MFPFHFGPRFLKLNCPMYQPGFDGSRSSVDPVHLRCCGFVLDSSLISLSNQVHRAITCPTGEDGQGCKVGDCNGRHGRHRGSRGRDGAGCPPASVGSNPGGPNVQVKECESFLVRARSHLAQPQCWRTSRLPRSGCRSQGPSCRHLLRRKSREDWCLSCRDIQSPNPKRPRRREDFIPHCDEEMQEWMECRHQDLQAAVAACQLRSGEDFLDHNASSTGMG